MAAAILKRTPDDKLPSEVAARIRIAEYRDCLKDAARSDEHRTAMARIKALSITWGIGAKANPSYNPGLLASKSDVDEYATNGGAVGVYRSELVEAFK